MNGTSQAVEPRLSRSQYLPGLAVVAAGVAAAYAINSVVPALSALTVAMLLGAAVRNFGLLNPRIAPGAAAGTKKLLRAGVVLLGLQLSVGQIEDLGFANVAVVLATVAATFFGTRWLGTRLGVSPGCALLVATGFAICGASAVAAMSGVADSEEEDVATSVALVTLFGSLAIVVLPLLQAPLGLSDAEYGVWAGASVHEVAQVVAAAAAAGAAAVGIAVVAKLTRVVLLAPLVAGVSLARFRHARVAKRPPVVPLFVLGFLAMVAVRSLGLLPALALDAAKLVTTLLLAGALFGLGTSVHLPSLLRTGARPIALGALSTVLAAAVALSGIKLAGLL
ncbi:putative sulfate exporter family transporter [Micromonospora sp. NPDC005305]|uniref:YeiH family protein n=1 Tax=Micromonospora sp. NPDC005305 TaxID=3156875 RepID=UPI0033AFEDF6